MTAPTTGWWSPKTQVVLLDDKHKVYLRKPTWAEQQDAISKSAKIDGLTGTMIIDFARLRKEQMLVCIIDWEGPNFDGVPVSQEAINSLPYDVGSQLYAELKEFLENATIDEGREKNLVGPMNVE